MSESISNLRSYLLQNLVFVLAPPPEMPITSQLIFLNCSIIPEKAFDSIVHPGVSSFG